MKAFKKPGLILFVLFAVYLLLMIPPSEEKINFKAEKNAFHWNRDSLWISLERRFSVYKSYPLDWRKSKSDSAIKILARFSEVLKVKETPSRDPIYDSIEREIFSSASVAASCPEMFPALSTELSILKSLIRKQSIKWDTDEISLNRKYRLLYGIRASLEECFIQTPDLNFSFLDTSETEKSRTPSQTYFGVKIHSGDILVSRGGAPVSALISRANDRPGNFSHVALVYIGKEASVIESHIEKGVAVSGVEEYLKDKKLRIMVLRPKLDHPLISSDPMLPHEAAEAMFAQTFLGHIPYDFQLNYKDHGKMFCSEVASTAYEMYGFELWSNKSSVSSAGMANWLFSLGVTNFESELPSDLEYDNNLSVVAEWRDKEELFKDHVHNAVMDVLLESAEKGEELDYELFKLPIARIMKAWSTILNSIGKTGPVPEGMDAATALKSQKFSERHLQMSEAVFRKCELFHKEKGYHPPYWEILKIAKTEIIR